MNISDATTIVKGLLQNDYFQHVSDTERVEDPHAIYATEATMTGSDDQFTWSMSERQALSTFANLSPKQRADELDLPYQTHSLTREDLAKLASETTPERAEAFNFFPTAREAVAVAAYESLGLLDVGNGLFTEDDLAELNPADPEFMGINRVEFPDGRLGWEASIEGRTSQNYTNCDLAQAQSADGSDSFYENEWTNRADPGDVLAPPMSAPTLADSLQAAAPEAALSPLAGLFARMKAPPAAPMNPPAPGHHRKR